MPEPTPADALERMRRQVRAVRWRQNLHELQRALYHLLATLAAAATALVVLALLSTPGLFAAAAWGLGAGSVLLAAWITRALGRRWLAGARTPLWIDRHARLEGRLATALELERRGGARASFFPLLVDDNARRLAAWRPERLVPEGMPSGAFAGALAAVGALLLALLIAPWLQPSTPAAVPANAPGRIAIVRRGRPPAARRDGAREAERDGGAGPHQAAAGAGTGTDPNLLGNASAERAARERFELPLAARVHALGGGPAPPSAGEAPPPAGDAHPDLAAAQRRDAPVLKMSVPPAYEAVVRAAFAHQGTEAPP